MITVDDAHGTTERQPQAASSWPRMRSALISAILCALVLLGVFEILPDPLMALNTPEIAWMGGARAASADTYVLYSLVGVIGLVVIGIFHLRIPRDRLLLVIPTFSLLPLYAITREQIARVEQVPAFHQNFAASCSALEDFALQVDQGLAPPIPSKLGSFDIVAYEKAGQAVVLYTKIDKYSRWGFVRFEGAPFRNGRAGLVGLEGDIANRTAIESIGTHWYVLFDHYWYVKRGWS